MTISKAKVPIYMLFGLSLLFLNPTVSLEKSPQAGSEDQNAIVIEDFSSYQVGKYPAGLKWRKGGDSGDVEDAKKDDVDIFKYQVEEQDGNKYLHVRAEYRPGHAVSVILEVKKTVDWNINKYPILSWRWRVHEVPPGADERFTETNDSAAGVSLVYGKKFPFIPITIKYVWSSTLPVGAVAYRPGKGHAHVIVLGSGSEELGKWVTIERNVYEDYVKIFGKRPPNKPEAIVIQSDANRTPGGAADADYDEFKVLSSYSEGFPKAPFKLLPEYMKDNK